MQPPELLQINEYDISEELLVVPNVPIKHHYVPQFMLKNFCFKDKLLYYYDKVKSITLIKKLMKYS